MMPYEKLTAWKAAHELAVGLYRATDKFPSSERYGLTSQLRRSGFSVAANIAEGVAKRGTTGEFRRFLDIAIGSLSEISYSLLLSQELGLLTVPERQRLEEMRTVAAKLTWGLYKATARRRNAAPSARPTV